MSRGQRPQRKRRRRSLIYLRVSDRKQVNTDYDPEGSPCQRSGGNAAANQRISTLSLWMNTSSRAGRRPLWTNDRSSKRCWPASSKTATSTV